MKRGLFRLCICTIFPVLSAMDATDVLGCNYQPGLEESGLDKPVNELTVDESSFQQPLIY